MEKTKTTKEKVIDGLKNAGLDNFNKNLKNFKQLKTYLQLGVISEEQYKKSKDDYYSDLANILKNAGAEIIDEDVLKKEIEKLQNELKVAQNNIESITTEKNRVKDEFNNTLKKLEISKQDNQNVQNETACVKKENDELREALNRVKTEYEKNKVECVETKKSLKSAEEEKKKMQQSLESTLKERENDKTNNEKFQNDLKSITDENDKLKEKIKMLTKDNEKNKEEYKKAQNSIQKMTEENTNLKNDTLLAKKKLDEYETEKNQLPKKEEFEKVQSKCNEYEEYIKKMKVSIEKNKNAIEEWKIKMVDGQKAKDAEIEELKKQLEESKNAAPVNNINEDEFNDLKEKAVLSSKMVDTAIGQLILKDNMLKQLKQQPELLEKIPADAPIKDEEQYRVFLAEKLAQQTQEQN